MWPFAAFAGLFWDKPGLNERLALARAQTVHEHILRQMPQGLQVSFEGLGAQDPLVKHCEKSLSFITLSCNAPNRRVVVDFKKLNTYINATHRFA
jgi:outer membrane protein OmpA-like peptidoglycan-associated protein